jgi:hypothetical protein
MDLLVLDRKASFPVGICFPSPQLAKYSIFIFGHVLCFQSLAKSSVANPHEYLHLLAMCSLETEPMPSYECIGACVLFGNSAGVEERRPERGDENRGASGAMPIHSCVCK